MLYHFPMLGSRKPVGHDTEQVYFHRRGSRTRFLAWLSPSPAAWTLGITMLPLCICRSSQLNAKRSLRNQWMPGRPKTRSLLEVVGGRGEGRKVARTWCEMPRSREAESNTRWHDARRKRTSVLAILRSSRRSVFRWSWDWVREVFRDRVLAPSHVQKSYFKVSVWKPYFLNYNFISYKRIWLLLWYCNAAQSFKSIPNQNLLYREWLQFSDCNSRMHRQESKLHNQEQAIHDFLADSLCTSSISTDRKVLIICTIVNIHLESQLTVNFLGPSLFTGQLWIDKVEEILYLVPPCLPS
jgi:hypothetical protein